MIVVLSGEGPTDLGRCKNAQGRCEDVDFQIGPMTVLLDQMLEVRLEYSPRTIPSGYRYISEAELVAQAQFRKQAHRQVSLVGKKRSHETRYFYINAWMLADIAQHIETENEDQSIAVLFRDCDGTRSTAKGLWEAKWQSMVDGFKRVEFNRGVPMLPKPKSEAWLLCAAKYELHNCAKLEDISGNDDSPNSAKDQLDSVFGSHKSAEELCEWLEMNPIDVAKAESMPSFQTFKTELDRAVGELLH